MYMETLEQECLQSPSVDVPALLQASQDSADGRILELKQTVRQEVERHSTMEQIDQALTVKLHALFPLQRRTAVNVWQDSLLQQHSAQAWKHFHLVRAQSKTLGGLVKAWKHWTMFQKWQKQYTQRGKAVRKERRLQLLREAQTAADRHDQWKLYQIVRRLAPRQRHCKLQLKAGGCLLSPVEEMKVVHRHFQELFSPGQGSELPDRSLDSSIPSMTLRCWRTWSTSPCGRQYRRQQPLGVSIVSVRRNCTNGWDDIFDRCGNVVPSHCRADGKQWILY